MKADLSLSMTVSSKFNSVSSAIAPSTASDIVDEWHQRVALEQLQDPLDENGNQQERLLFTKCQSRNFDIY